MVLLLIFLHVSYKDKENVQCYLLLRHVKVTGIPYNVSFMHCNCILLFKYVTQFLETTIGLKMREYFSPLVDNKRLLLRSHYFLTFTQDIFKRISNCKGDV